MRLEAYRSDGFGDWYVCRKTGGISIKVAASDVWDEPEAFCIAIHELVEARACFAAGITEAAVDAFDIQFEKERADGLHGADAEPGDDPRSPYRQQHADALAIEGLMRRVLGCG